MVTGRDLRSLPQPTLMRSLLCSSALVFLLAACGTPNNPEPEKKTIFVSPYSSLSDSELNSEYLVILRQLQVLNTEMDVANKKRDFETVHAMAQTGLEKARTARSIARHIDHAEIRRKRLAALETIIGDLSNLVEITR